MKDERRLPRETNLVTENPRTITEDDSHENLSPVHPPTHLGHTPSFLGGNDIKGILSVVNQNLSEPRMQLSKRYLSTALSECSS